MKNISKYIYILVLFLVAGLAGFFVSIFLNDMNFNLITFFVFLFFIYFISTIIHEGGHLIFGLISGYKFVSFRVFNIILIKSDNKLHLKKFSISGTAGQCSMSPPEVQYNELPYFLFNAGGSLFNFIFAILSLILSFYINDYWKPILIYFTFFNIMYGLLNIIPLKMGFVNNDGQNILDIKRNLNARRVLKLDLSVDTFFVNGVRIKDMPKELFFKPGVEDRDNYLANLAAYYYVLRLMDEHKFEEVKEYIYNFFESGAKIIGLGEFSMRNELIYCELITDNIDAVKVLLNKECLKNMKKLNSFPATYRVQYTIALLYHKDIEEADKFLEKFNKLSNNYYLKGSIESDIELIKIAKNKMK